MQLGMIGLGRMGGNMVRRLMRNGHDCVVFDLDPSNVSALAKEGASGAGTLDAFVQALTPPRAAWVMRRLASRPSRPSRPSPRACSRATSSSTAATPTTKTMCGGRLR